MNKRRRFKAKRARITRKLDRVFPYRCPSHGGNYMFCDLPQCDRNRERIRQKYGS